MKTSNPQYIGINGIQVALVSWLLPKLLGTICVILFLLVPAMAHDWYTGLQSPITNGSCCSDKDCHPTRAWTDEDGHWWVIDQGKEIRVPDNAILHMTAPDGNSHVCIGTLGVVCFIRGVPKS